MVQDIFFREKQKQTIVFGLIYATLLHAYVSEFRPVL